MQLKGTRGAPYSAAAVVAVALFAAGCPNTPVEPYDSCGSGDSCSGGLSCIDTSLPASTGITGSFCSSACQQDSDCVQVPTNFAANCVNDQCYLTCPSSDSCPYDQSCVQFTDQNGNAISLCSP
jgi:hypothetical protein